MGFYQDIFSDFGHLGDESLRACRLVIDTGIHYLGWNRTFSVEYMLGTFFHCIYIVENTPMSRLDVESEVDRYVVWPGQALGYKIGELKIQELRKKGKHITHDLKLQHNPLSALHLIFGSFMMQF